MYSFKQLINIIKTIEASEYSMAIDAEDGFSGAKFLDTLSKLASIATNSEKIYLEVGVFRGLTLTSVAKNINSTAYGIDNFAFFDKNNENFNIVKQKIKNKQLNNVEIINQDYEIALKQLETHIGERKIGLYFIDGPHDYRSQLTCLLLAKKHLADKAIIVIDDCNYNDVRQANLDFVDSHPDYKLIYQNYGKAHPDNLTQNDFKEARKNWWDGINVIVHDPHNELIPIEIPVNKNKSLFTKDQLVHSDRYANSCLKAMDLYRNARDKNLFRATKLFLLALISKIETNNFKTLNTYSDKIEYIKFAKLKNNDN